MGTALSVASSSLNRIMPRDVHQTIHPKEITRIIAALNQDPEESNRQCEVIYRALETAELCPEIKDHHLSHIAGLCARAEQGVQKYRMVLSHPHNTCRDYDETLLEDMEGISRKGIEILGKSTNPIASAQIARVGKESDLSAFFAIEKLKEMATPEAYLAVVDVFKVRPQSADMDTLFNTMLSASGGHSFKALVKLCTDLPKTLQQHDVASRLKMDVKFSRILEDYACHMDFNAVAVCDSFTPKLEQADWSELLSLQYLLAVKRELETLHTDKNTTENREILLDVIKGTALQLTEPNVLFRYFKNGESAKGDSAIKSTLEDCIQADALPTQEYGRKLIKDYDDARNLYNRFEALSQQHDQLSGEMPHGRDSIN